MRALLKHIASTLLAFVVVSLIYPSCILAQTAVTSDVAGQNIDIATLFTSFGWGKYYAIFTTVTSLGGIILTQVWPYVKPPTTQSSVWWTILYHLLNTYVMCNHHYAANAVTAPSVAEVKAAKT